ncbi:MAG: sulfite exporter TauE/SafE family protein [Deltaproteobacteria bacterium]|nr:sulfite exporter TauE/SafE family protein [Deltaproteobacteria bacterium]MBW2012556.1 sulfite exporter TauE/SafE family protein [Deltaproteobacteria bacterium]MBW2089050.1 sulfite exporter TauE/SafE family protein [Deltaproteobacteria bacterium]MBW2320223.1 sulfite exporter TauE/SafE family protein [Deltaproteobacteria bacterium]
MKKPLFLVVLLSIILVLITTGAGICAATATVSASEYKAGDLVTIEGAIDPGQDLYLVIASQKTFAPKDTEGVHEVKTFKKDAKKKDFTQDSTIPALYYILTTKPEKFGKVTIKKFGGPSFFTQKGKRGLYETTMFKLAKYDNLDEEAKNALVNIKTATDWNFFKYAHESSYGINTIVKEKTNVGKVTIFARSVLGDYNKTNNYWDKGTSIDLDKNTGKFKASFRTFRHTPPDTMFDVYVNGTKSTSYSVKGKGFWLKLGGRYMNPLWIVIGAILVSIYFSMIGAAGGMLMAAFQVIVVQTAGPIGINAANVLRPSNMALTLFSPLGSFYRYAIVERRVAWPVGISFGLGIFIGSIWLGKYVVQYLPMKSYKEWLAVLVVIMGAKTIHELTPKAMEKRKSIKAMAKKFNEEVARAKAEGRATKMGKIEPVKTGLTNYSFKFWGEEFTINPLLFGVLGVGIGIVSRCFGIGGGFLLVPAMTTIGALPMYVAVPISLIGTCFSSVGSFIGYLLNSYMPDLWLMLAIIIGGFVGGMLGSRAQKLFSEKTLKIVLAITLFFLFFRFFKIEIWI